MQKFLALTTLNALDPLPALGRKVEANSPAFNPAPSAAELFERTPHELHSQRPGPARRDADDFYDAFAAGFEQFHIDGNTVFGRFAFGAVASASPRGAELLRPVVPDGDQRDPGEGQSRHGDARGHEASNRADPGNPWSCERACREAEERFDASQGRTQGEAGRAGAVGSALIDGGLWHKQIQLAELRKKGGPASWTLGLTSPQLLQAYEDRVAILDKPGERNRCLREYFDALPFARL